MKLLSHQTLPQFIFRLNLAIFVVMFFSIGLALPTKTTRAACAPTKGGIILNVPIPGVGTEVRDEAGKVCGYEIKPGKSGDKESPPQLVAYIKGMYKFFVGIAGILAVFMLMFGGVQWLFSGGNASKIASAKETIFGAVIGLVLALGSYTLLVTINPRLVKLSLSTNLGIDIQAITATLCKDVVLPPGTPNNFECTSGCSGQAASFNTQCGSTYKIPGTDEICYGVVGCDESNGEACMVDKLNNESACLECKKLARTHDYNPFDALGISSPPELACKQLFHFSDSKKHCEYVEDLALNPHGTCAYYELNCDNIESCSDYDDVRVSGTTPSGLVGTRILSTLANAIGIGVSVDLRFLDDLMIKVCNENPCQANSSSGGCYIEKDHGSFLDIGAPQKLCKDK